MMGSGENDCLLVYWLMECCGGSMDGSESRGSRGQKKNGFVDALKNQDTDRSKQLLSQKKDAPGEPRKWK